MRSFSSPEGRVWERSACHANNQRLVVRRDMEHEDWLLQKSEYATAAVTPGAADSYGKSFKAVANHRLKILKKITEGQAAMQSNSSHVSGPCRLPMRQRALRTCLLSAMTNTGLTCVVDERQRHRPLQLQRRDMMILGIMRTKRASCSRTTMAFSLVANGKYFRSSSATTVPMGSALPR